MKDRYEFHKLAIAFAVCLVCIGLSAPAAAQTVCSGTASLDGGEYIFQSNEWNSTLPQCAAIDGIGFTLTTANFDQGALGSYIPATYPSVYRGCHWGDCTTSSPFPIQMSNLGSATSSVSIVQPGGYVNDSAYDIWFNQTSTTTGQPNGTEVMIWINHQGGAGPAGSLAGTVTIDGASYQVYTGRMSSWNIASYVANPGVDSVTNLNLIPFFNDAISRGMLQSSWWLIDVEYGFEVWNGGQGLSATNFSVNATAGGTGGGGGTCTATAITPYISVSGAWTEETSATVTSTATVVDLGPQPETGGTWSWTGPNGFTSTAREIDGIALSAGANAYTATYTNSCGAKSTQTFTITAPGGSTGTGTAITPYLQVNAGAWQETNVATVAAGSTVNLGPQPVGGTWAWTGPNGFTSNAREIDGIPLTAASETFVATYTNASGAKSTETFTITVTGLSGGGTGNLIANGTYVITSVHSGLALGDPNSSTANSAVMEQLAVTSGTNEQWTVNNLGNNVITLTNGASGQMLDVNGASVANGALVDQWPANGQNNQKWTVISLGGGHYELTSVNSGLALDVDGGVTTAGAEIDQYTYNGNSWQQWIFTAK